jgi:DNA-binding FadR family transcriptional regulator
MDAHMYGQPILEHSVASGLDHEEDPNDQDAREQRRMATKMYRIRMSTNLSSDELAAKRRSEAERKRLARARMSEDELASVRAKNAQQKREVRASYQP